MLGYLFWSISFFFQRGGPFGRRNSPAKFGRKIGRFFKNLKNFKKKKIFFFSQVFLRPAHYTLGTLLRPKSQKKHELGCFEHLEFIPQPFSVPPVHFVWASALSKNLKISKKKNFFFGKISTTEVGLWAPKNAKKMQKSGVLTICGYTKHTSVYKPTPIQW